MPTKRTLGAVLVAQLTRDGKRGDDVAAGPPPAISTRSDAAEAAPAPQSISRVMFSSTPMPASVTNRTGAAEGDERQRDALGGQQRDGDAHVEERLDQDRGRQAEGQEARERIRREECRTHAAVAEDDEQRDQRKRTEQAKLFTRCWRR